MTSTIGGSSPTVTFSDATTQASAAYTKAQSREVLFAARTYYVRTDGSNSNTGLANTSGGAFLTIQKAIDVILGTLDLGGYNVTISVATGTYTTAITATSPQVGDATTPSNVLLQVASNNVLYVSGAGTNISIKGVKFVTTTSGSGINVTIGGRATVSGNVDYGACATFHNYADFGGTITMLNISYNITGASNAHWYIASGGFVFAQGITWTITGTPAFAFAFCYAAGGQLYGISYTVSSGSATGVRYSVILNGVVNTNGGGATAFPGGTAGTTATGGQYA